MTDLDHRLLAIEAALARGPQHHPTALIASDLVLVLVLAVVIGMLGIVLNNQTIGRRIVASSHDQNQKILNNQEIIIANMKWANTMIHGRCRADNQ